MASAATAAPVEGSPGFPRAEGATERRILAINEFKRKLTDHREIEAKLKELRLGLKGLEKEFDQSENDIKALQSVGQIIGEVIKALDDERCK